MFVLCFCKAVILVILKGLENEVNTAPYASNLILTGYTAVSVLASEELESGYDVLSPSIVSTEFPALQGTETCNTILVVIGSLHSCDWRQGTICYISTPRTLLSSISTLIAYLCTVCIIAEAMLLRLITTSVVESSLHILVERIAKTSIYYLVGASTRNRNLICSSYMTAYTSLKLAIVVKNFSTTVSSRRTIIGSTGFKEIIANCTSTIVPINPISIYSINTTTSSLYLPVGSRSIDNLSTSYLVIEEQAMGSIREGAETTELDISLAVYALCINLGNLCTVLISTSLISIYIIVNLGVTSPVLVDGNGRSETQLDVVITNTSSFFTPLTMLIGSLIVSGVPVITDQASPLNVVSLSLEVSNANAQVSQLIGELSGQLLDESLVVVVSSIGLSHSLGNNLSHLITAHALVTLEGAVSGIAVYYAVLYQLSNSIVCPMVCRNISERISSCKSSGSSAYYQSGSQCGYESLLHKEIPPFTNKKHLFVGDEFRSLIPRVAMFPPRCTSSSSLTQPHINIPET